MNKKRKKGRGKRREIYVWLITLWTNDQPPPLFRPSINCLDDINQLLLILQHPVQLVVVARAEIAHHVFVAEEKHERDRVVEFVHLFEIGHLI